jgi:hypothetical protein
LDFSFPYIENAPTLPVLRYERKVNVPTCSLDGTLIDECYKEYYGFMCRLLYLFMEIKSRKIS